MRRSVSIVFVILILGLLTAAPALAQGRDPFEPQPGGTEQEAEDSGSSERDPFNPELGGGGEEPAVQESPDDPTDPVTEPTAEPAPADPNDDTESTLANTGADVSTWGAVAYLLIVLGAAAIVAARTFAPAPSRRRR